MARLDPRLQDLIETLVAARLDWLAFELMNGIRLGQQAPELPEVLGEVRRSVRSAKRPTERAEPVPQDEHRRPIEGDEQIEWASSYVADRLEGLIAELGAAMDNLDSLGRSDGRSANPARDGKSGSPLLVVLDDEEPRKVERDGVEVALKALPLLRARVMAWSNAARGQIRT